MLKAMSFGSYIPGNSILHRTDPRTKITLTLFFIIVTFLERSNQALTVMLLFTFGMAWLAGRTLQHSLRGLKPIIYMAAFTATAHLFFDGGPALAESGILTFISRDGAWRSLRMILMLTVLASGTSLLTATTTPLALSDGLQWLMKPLRCIGLPVNDIALMMSLSLRFIPVIAEEAERLINSHKEHSAVFSDGILLQRARSCIPLLIPLFAGVVRRGDALATAMDARCYGACQERTRMHPLRLSSADFISSGVVLAFLIMLLYFERLWSVGL